MCAIFGIGLFRDNIFTGYDRYILQTIIRRLANICENSGREASGVSIMQERTLRYFKKNIRGSLLANCPGYKDLMAKSMEIDVAGKLTQSIIGHTRYPTKGEPTNNDNNHPIVAGHIVGVHNGSIFNDDELFEKFSLERTGRVDTEIIFRLIEHFSEDVTDSTITAIQKSTAILEGSYACAFQNIRKPYNLYLFRKTNPTTLWYWDRLGLLAFASRVNYLEHAFEGLETADTSYDFTGPEEIEMLPETGMCINLYDSTYHKFPLRKERNAGV